MDMNLTLVGQMITFVIFIWFTVKFVWPPLMNIMEVRRANIASGLEAAAKGEQLFLEAEAKMKATLAEAKSEASVLIDQANQRASVILEEARAAAKVEGDRLLTRTQDEIGQAYAGLKADLMQELSALVIAGTEKVLAQSIQDKSQYDRELLDLIAAKDGARE